MTHAREIKLTTEYGTEPLGLLLTEENACSIEMRQTAEKYMPIPGTGASSDWAYYRPGDLSWSLSADAYISNAARTQIFRMSTFLPVVGYIMRLILGTLNGYNIVMKGSAFIKQRKILAEYDGFAKISVTMEGSDFPEVKMEDAQ